MKINTSETSPALAQRAAARHFAPMTLPVTLALLAAAVALAVFAGWRGARPSQPHLGVRMAPWRFIMVMAAAAIFLLVLHLGALLGLMPPPR